MSDSKRAADPRPNIIWIMSDDLSWADLGCCGQKKIETPNIDALAASGMIFSQCYSGSTVCAPSRSSLMQGLHQGHATVRANMLGGYRHCLQADDVTVADLMKSAGYATGQFGKWGLSNYDQPGIPTNKGYDEFYGYLNQRHAHNYYPTHLWHNEEKIPYPQHEGFDHKKPRDYDENGRVIPNGMADPSKAKYSFDECCGHSLEFVREHSNEPFFLYLPYTPPHGVLIVPELGQYANLDWPDIRHKEWAAMITRMDAEVGKLVALLKELGIYENTLIFFCSDNGYSPFGTIPKELVAQGVPTLEEFFEHRGPFKGGKGDLREGGLRVPMIAHWPTAIRSATTSDQPWAFWDFRPTAAELAGAKLDAPTDGISIVPTLKGETDKQPQHDFFYWEFFGREGLEQAARFGNHRAFCPHAGAPIEVYDVTTDSMEEHDIAGANPELVKRAEEIFGREHTQSVYFPDPGETLEAWKARCEAQGGKLLDNVNTF